MEPCACHSRRIVMRPIKSANTCLLGKHDWPPKPKQFSFGVAFPGRVGERDCTTGIQVPRKPADCLLGAKFQSSEFLSISPARLEQMLDSLCRCAAP
jgi:hypothetical protein